MAEPGASEPDQKSTGLALLADHTTSPGDTSCGFLRPSVVGPRELKE
jgi:hypothetical protein